VPQWLLEVPTVRLRFRTGGIVRQGQLFSSVTTRESGEPISPHMAEFYIAGCIRELTCLLWPPWSTRNMIVSAPVADPRRIVLTFKVPKGLDIDAHGDLVLLTDLGVIVSGASCLSRD